MTTGVKPTESAKRLMPDAPMETPYEGAREMLLVDSTDSRDFLSGLLDAMLGELPVPGRRR